MRRSQLGHLRRRRACGGWPKVEGAAQTTMFKRLPTLRDVAETAAVANLTCGAIVDA